MKNTVAPSAQPRFPVKFFIAFRSVSRTCGLLKFIAIILSSNYLLDQLQFFYYYHMLSCLFYGCYYIFFNWFIKKVLLINHNIVVFYFYFQKKILCPLFDVHYIQMIKQNVYLHPENFDQLSNLNIGFVFLLLLLTFPVNCSLEKNFNCCTSFVLTLVDKVSTRTESFVSVNCYHCRPSCKRNNTICRPS